MPVVALLLSARGQGWLISGRLLLEEVLSTQVPTLFLQINLIYRYLLSNFILFF